MKFIKISFISVVIFFTLSANPSILSAYEYLGQDADGNDIYEMDPFVVDGNDPNTFDRDGYWDWFEEQYDLPWWMAPDPFDTELSTGGDASPAPPVPPQAPTEKTSDNCGANAKNNKSYEPLVGPNGNIVYERELSPKKDSSRNGVSGIFIQELTYNFNMSNPDGDVAEITTKDGKISGDLQFVFYEAFVVNENGSSVDTWITPA
jgi:hypothetical protein